MRDAELFIEKTNLSITKLDSIYLLRLFKLNCIFVLRKLRIYTVNTVLWTLLLQFPFILIKLVQKTVLNTQLLIVFDIFPSFCFPPNFIRYYECGGFWVGKLACILVIFDYFMLWILEFLLPSSAIDRCIDSRKLNRSIFVWKFWLLKLTTIFSFCEIFPAWNSCFLLNLSFTIYRNMEKYNKTHIFKTYIIDAVIT